MARSILVSLSLLLAPALVGADGGWGKMKAGMSAEETAAMLGTPLLQTSNRGFQLWTYSDRAEVVFYRGPVVAWTAPVSNAAAAKKPISSDVSVLPGGILLRSTPVGPKSVLEQAATVSNETRFRYNARPVR